MFLSISDSDRKVPACWYRRVRPRLFWRIQKTHCHTICGTSLAQGSEGPCPHLGPWDMSPAPHPAGDLSTTSSQTASTPCTGSPPQVPLKGIPGKGALVHYPLGPRHQPRHTMARTKCHVWKRIVSNPGSAVKVSVKQECCRSRAGTVLRNPS